MWAAEVIEESARVHRYLVRRDQGQLTIADMVRLLRDDAAFRGFLMETLAGSPMAAFRWEMPALTEASIGAPCEFVLHDAPRLSARADPGAFAKHFLAAGGKLAVAFSNLGGDATLIVPTPQAAPEIYAHFAVFLRQAPQAQRDELLALVGATALRQISSRPVWLSTAGMGVAWLHVRPDSSPKYFGYHRYTRV
jgi:hypothetical protein